MVGASAVTVTHDLVYVDHDGEPLRGDFYRSVASEPAPAMVLIHGGAMVRGSRQSLSHWGHYLAAHGINAFAVNYRLAGPDRSTFPESIFDTRAAVQYLRANADRYAIAGDKIGVMGGSSGGYLAAMVTLTGRDPQWISPYQSSDGFEGVSGAVDVAVTMSGVFDLLAMWEHDQLNRPPGTPMERYLGGDPMEVRSRYFEASPIFHTSYDACRGTTWLVGYGSCDDVVPPESQSVRFVSHLKRAGALVRVSPIAGEAHYWYRDSPLEDGASSNRLFARRLRSFLTAWTDWSGSVH